MTVAVAAKNDSVEVFPVTVLGPIEGSLAPRRRTEMELNGAPVRLRVVYREHWDRDRRTSIAGRERHFEDHLSEVAAGYLDLLEKVHRVAAENGGGSRVG